MTWLGHDFRMIPELHGAVIASTALLRCERCGCMSFALGGSPWYLPPPAQAERTKWQADKPECKR